MPTKDITTPDGRTFPVTYPEGATDEQILAYAQANIKNVPAGKKEKQQPGVVERGLEQVAKFMEAPLGKGVQEGGDPETLPPEAKAIRVDKPKTSNRLEADVFGERQALEKAIRAVGGNPYVSPKWRALTQELSQVKNRHVENNAGMMFGAEGFLKEGPGVFRTGVGMIKNYLQRGLAHIAEVDTEKAAKAVSLADKGIPVAPSAYATLPALQRRVEKSRIFGYDPVKSGAVKYGKEQAVAMLQRSGLSPEDAQKEAARLAQLEQIDLEKAGSSIKAAARIDLYKAQGALEQAIAQAKKDAAKQGLMSQEGRARQLELLMRSQKILEAQLDEDLQKGFKGLEDMRALRDPKHLAVAMEGKVRKLRELVLRQADSRYKLADVLAGDHLIDVADARQAAKEFLYALPEDIRRNMPTLVASIGRMDTDSLTFGELRYLRSQLRDLGYLDNEKLSPSFKRGPYKYLSTVVDNIIHEAGTTEELKGAVRALDEADAFYHKNMARFKDELVQRLVDNTKAGLPPDPVMVARQVVQATTGNSSRLKEILQIAGPKVAEKIRSADYDDIMALSKDPLTGDVDGKSLLTHLEKREKDGTLSLLWGDKEASAILEQARKLAARHGAAPVELLPPGQFRYALTEANKISEHIAELAKVDPERLMNEALREGDKRAKGLEAMERDRQDMDPLKPFVNPQLMARAAAEEMLDPNNLPRLKAAIARWGPDAPAVTLIRRAALERALTPLMREENPVKMANLFSKMPKEQQDVLFPGGMADDLRSIVEDLSFIYGSRQRSMPGFSVGSTLDQPIGPRLKHLYFTNTLTWLITRPQFVKMLASSVQRGGEYEVEARKNLVATISRMAWAEYMTDKAHSTETYQPQAQQQPQAPQLPDWRHRLQGLQ